MELLNRIVRPAALVLVVVGLLADPAAARDEYEVKGAFLFNFARYVEWPAGAPGVDGDLAICVLGDEGAAFSVEKVIAGKQVGGRTVSVHPADGLEDSVDCRILFVTRGTELPWDEITGGLAGKSVLTVGEDPAFATEGGVVAFTDDGGKVRFDINQSAAKKADLRVSSKLLRLARTVHD